MSKQRIITASLTAHPRDSRVAETTSLRAFKSVTSSDTYQAAVLHRYTRPEKSKLHNTFAQILEQAKRENTFLNLDKLIHGTARKSGFIIFSDFPEEYKLVRQEFQAMVNTYHAMTSFEKIQLFVIPDFDTGPDHKPHNYPVLNCTWLHNGSLWTNQTGETLQVSEGNWFFFKKYFSHLSPKTPRITAITIPYPGPASV